MHSSHFAGELRRFASNGYVRLAFVLAAVALFASMLTATPAAAAGISVNPSSGGFDTTFTFTATGFQRNEIVDTWVGIPNLNAVGTGTLRANDAGTVKWSFQPKPSYKGGEYIGVANGRASGRVSVKFYVAAPPSDNNNSSATATPGPVVIQPVSARTAQFSGRGYKAGELVNTWYLSPNGHVYGYNNFTADAWGNLTFNFVVPYGWMFGGYQLVGRGTSSGQTNYITFSYFGKVSDVRASNPVTKNTPYYDFWQGGFTAWEPVQIWIGFPNGSTQALATVNANGNGNVYYRVNIPPSWQYGGYIVVGYGNKSHVTQYQRFSYFGTVNRMYP